MEGNTEEEKQTKTTAQEPEPREQPREPSKEEMQRASAAFNQVIENAFESMWNADKEKLKGYSKKDLAHHMFVEGIRFMVYVMNNQRQAETGGGGPLAPQQ